MALAAAALAAGFLAACGGSDSSTNSTASTPSTGASSEQDTTDRSQAGNGAGQQGQDDGSADQGSGGSDSGPVSIPLKVSGGGSEQFRGKGGDNSIQDFGEESDGAELEEAARALHGFYVARAEEDWSVACTYIAKSIARQLEQLGSRSPELKGKGCAAVLQTLTRPLPASARRESTVVDAGSLRSEDDQSFIIYYGGDRTAYAMPMVQEDGGWKVGLLAATPLE